MIVTPSTPWRHLGAVPLAIWQTRINDAGGLSEAAEQRVWAACGDDSALALAMLRMESSYGSNFSAIPAAWNNPWNLQTQGQGLHFSSIEAAANAWRERLYSRTYKSGIYTRTETIADLIEVYAPKSDGNDTKGYIAKVVAEINRNGFDVPVTTPATPAEPVDKEPAMAVQFGRVPMPGYIDRQAQTAGKPEGIGWDNLGKRTPKFIVLHRMIGTLWGTDDWFARPTVEALTDYGIGVEATDGMAIAGVICQWNDPRGYRSGWASGRVSAPYGDGKRIVDLLGLNAVNRDGVSIEISGYETTPIDATTWGELVALVAYWADQMHIPWDSRVNPATGINYLIFHQEFTIGTGKLCPWPVVMALVNQLYDDASALMRPYQLGEAGEVQPVPETPAIPAPKYAPPVPIPALAKYADIQQDRIQAVVTSEGHEFVIVNDTYRAIRQTKRLQYAMPTAQEVGPVIDAGLEFAVTWLVKSQTDGEWYAITPWWTRILLNDIERINDTVTA